MASSGLGMPCEPAPAEQSDSVSSAAAPPMLPLMPKACPAGLHTPLPHHTNSEGASASGQVGDTSTSGTEAESWAWASQWPDEFLPHETTDEGHPASCVLVGDDQQLAPSANTHGSPVQVGASAWHQVQSEWGCVDDASTYEPVESVPDGQGADDSAYDRSAGTLLNDEATIDSRVGFDFLESVARLSTPSAITLPWETEFARQFFDPLDSLDPYKGCKISNAVPPLPRRPAPPNTHAPRKPEPAAGAAKFAWAVSLGSAVEDPASARERVRNRAISLWVIVVTRFRDKCLLYQAAVRDADKDVEAEIRASVEASMGSKSPYTILKRAAAVAAFVRWLDMFVPDAFTTITESCVWKYMVHLKESNAPATRATSFLSGLRFAKFVLQIDIPSVLESTRVAGLASQMLNLKRKLKQAPVLMVSQVLELHASLEDEKLHPYDRALSGSLLLRLYGRMRQSDTLFLERVELDDGEREAYIELTVSQHKGARTDAHKAKYLPILIPMIGVHGKKWIKELCDAFEAVGHVLSRVKGPLLPAPSTSSGRTLSTRAITSLESSRALRSLLALPEPGQGHEPQASSHALKATTLSWASKFGLSEDVKSILGRHASSTKTAQAIYSRDLCVGPVRELQGVINQISEGRFFPDRPRSEHFPFPHSPPAMTGPSVGSAVPSVGAPRSGDPLPAIKVEDAVKLENTDVVLCDTSSSSSSSSDSESSSTDAVVPRPPSKRFRAIRSSGEASQLWFAHKKSGVLHLHKPCDYPQTQLLACGRVLSASYVRASAQQLDTGNECRSCRRNM